MSVKKFSRQIRNCTADEYKGKVDFAIITIRSDEYRAVLKRFPTQIIARGEWDYSISQLQSFDGHAYTVAVVRCLRQGTNYAQRVTSDLIADLNPKWILTVGIAGGVPDSDFTLGDVIVSTHVYDLTVTAQNSDGSTEYSISGGPVPREVERVLASLEARADFVENWNKAIGCRRPTIDINKQADSGDTDYQNRVAQSLHRHFVEHRRKTPIFAARPVVSSNALMKAPDIVRTWLKFARHFAAIDMEFAGVYQAARRLGKDYAVATIRGISDIVGLPRDERWTKYACHSAAAFVHALIKYGHVLPQQPGSTTVAPDSSGGQTVEDVQQLATRYLLACEKAASAAQRVDDRRHPELEDKNMSTDLRIGRYTDQGRFSVIFISDYYQHAFSSIQTEVYKWYIGVYNPQSSDETAILRELPRLLDRPGERSRELNEATPPWIRDELKSPLVVGLIYRKAYR
jgi:nucleoside phosphorylase